MNLEIKTFNELTTLELHKILAARSEVFIVEQECAFQDVDNIDYEADHIIFFDEDNEVAAYSRIYIKEGYVWFGRILTAKKYRGTGLGKELLEVTIKHIKNKYSEYDMYIQAQSYLQDFYGSFGFVVDGEEYLEDGLPHIDMICKK